jgi:hypothetical protein
MASLSRIIADVGSKPWRKLHNLFYPLAHAEKARTLGMEAVSGTELPKSKSASGRGQGRGFG